MDVNAGFPQTSIQQKDFSKVFFFLFLFFTDYACNVMRSQKCHLAWICFFHNNIAISHCDICYDVTTYPHEITFDFFITEYAVYIL